MVTVNCESLIKMIICLALVTFLQVTPFVSGYNSYPNFKGFSYRKNTLCQENTIGGTDLEKDSPQQCYVSCLEGMCTAVSYINSTRICKKFEKCERKVRTDTAETWLKCVAKNCHVCRNEKICDVCDPTSGKTGPLCKGFGTKFFDGYRYQANYGCKGGRVSKLPGTNKRSDECHSQCQKQRSCKGFTINIKAECELLKSSCGPPQKLVDKHLWRKCDVKQCKTCNTSINSCDVCKQGWGGKLCRKRVTTLPPTTTDPVSTDRGTKLLVKILLYVLFAATLTSCLGYLIGKNHFRRKQRR